MNKGIEILMARMDSNPDEFMGVNNKWVNLMDSYEDHMAEEDRKALYAKYSTLHMDKFTEHVMKKLLAEKEELVTQSPFTGSAGQIQGLYTAAGQAGMTGLQSQLAMTQAQAWAQQSAMAQNAYANTSSVSFPSTEVTSTINLGRQTLTEKTIKRLKRLASLQR